jgi:hypothetical protein
MWLQQIFDPGSERRLCHTGSLTRVELARLSPRATIYDNETDINEAQIEKALDTILLPSL